MSANTCTRDAKLLKNPRQPRPNTAPPKNSKRQAVVVHNRMTATPTEDWILYGDEVITVRHSSIRQRKADQACGTSATDKKLRNTGTTQPTMLPTPPGSSPAHSERGKKQNEDNKPAWQNDSNPQRQSTSNCLNPPKVGGSGYSMRGTTADRLPTPDLSDVDEDEMWACCTGKDHRHR